MCTFAAITAVMFLAAATPIALAFAGVRRRRREEFARKTYRKNHITSEAVARATALYRKNHIVRG